MKGKSCSEDEITAVHHPVMSIDSGRHLAVRGLGLNNSFYEGVWLTTALIADSPHFSSDVYAAYCLLLGQSCCIHQSNSAVG